MNSHRRLTDSHRVLTLLAVAALTPVLSASAQGVRRPLPQVAYQRLDSLEQAALTGTSFDARLHAVSTITSIASGQGDCVSGQAAAVVKYPGLVDRLAAIYRRSSDEALRHAILDRMLWAVECDAAAAFLARVAEEESTAQRPSAAGIHDGRPSRPFHAVGILSALGPSGESELRRLHGGATVRDSAARASLDRLARRGFQRPR